MGQLYPQWKHSSVGAKVYDDIVEANIGVETFATTKYLSFYESMILELLKFVVVKDSQDQELANKWVNASSFAEDSYRADRAGKQTHEDSTVDPSRSIFQKDFDEGGKHIKMEISEDCFRSGSPRLLDLQKVKESNMKLLSDEQTIRESIRRGKEQAELERQRLEAER